MLTKVVILTNRAFVLLIIISVIVAITFGFFVYRDKAHAWHEFRQRTKNAHSLFVRRLRVAENRIKAEAAEIRQMGIEKARCLGKQILEEKATFESWNGPVPANVNLILEKLDHSLQSLFRAHRAWFFSETGTEFDAELLVVRTASAIEGMYQVGLDKSLQHKLTAKPGSPVVFELNEDDRVIEEYPSIYHYFLLAERE